MSQSERVRPLISPGAAHSTVTEDVAGRRWSGFSARSSALAQIALVALLIAAAAFLYYQTRGTTLLPDDWKWALYRRGDNVDTFLAPYNEHFSLVPLVIYRIMFATVGLRDYAPYRVMVIAGHLTCVVLVFVYARRRVDSFLALCAAVLILFLGPGWQNIMWPFQIAWLISLGAGVGALLMVDRDDRLADGAACMLVGVSLASSGVGIPIAVGIGLDVLWGRRRWRSAWIAAVPLALYALWWLKYQQATPTSRLSTVPSFVADSAASALSALMGLGGDTVTVQQSGTLLMWGRPLGLIALVAVIWRLVRLRRIPPRVLTLLAMLLLFWLETALSRGFLGPSSAFPSRYLYVSGVLVVLLAVELLRGVSLRWPVATLIGGLVAAAAVANIGTLRDAGRVLRTEGQLTRADLGALDLSRDVVKRNYVATLSVFFGSVVAGPYFAAERAYGTPADSPTQLETEPEGARQSADAELLGIHGVALARSPSGLRLGTTPAVDSLAGGSLRRQGPCLIFAPGANESTTTWLDITLPPTGVLVASLGGSTVVGVRRFAADFQSVGSVPPPGSVVLRIGGDLAREPWHVRIAPADGARVCGLGSGVGAS